MPLPWRIPDVLISATGVSCQAWLCGELFLQCYTDQSPVEDVLHCICKSAFLVRSLPALRPPDPDILVEARAEGSLRGRICPVGAGRRRDLEDCEIFSVLDRHDRSAEATEASSPVRGPSIQAFASNTNAETISLPARTSCSS